jgi:hypothetical protein
MMTEDDMNEMAELTNELESTCFVQCKLTPVCKELGLALVSAEPTCFE